MKTLLSLLQSSIELRWTEAINSQWRSKSQYYMHEAHSATLNVTYAERECLGNELHDMVLLEAAINSLDVIAPSGR